MTGSITPVGVGTATIYTKLTSAGPGLFSALADPGSSNTPILFEPPAQLTGGQLEVWMIASGGVATATTGAATASGNLLHFAGGAIPPAVVAGAGVLVAEQTTSGVIPSGTTVTAVGATTVTLGNNVTGAGVGSGDTILFHTPNWGGCQVWVSTDNSTYSLAGTVYRGARQGVLTAALPSAADPDTSSTLAIDLAESQGQILSGSAADRDNFVTLCFCDGELIAYETAALTAAYRYALTSLRRGVYGTTIGAHSAGANFARFGPADPSLFRYTYPANLVGQTIYVKLPAFNLFGQNLQSLALVTADSYILTGAGTIRPANVPIQYLGSPQSGQPILRYTFGEAVSFVANFAGSGCTAGTAATAATTFNIAKNGTNFATMSFAAGATSASFSGSAASFASGDVLTITPTRTDASLANPSGILVGTS